MLCGVNYMTSLHFIWLKISDIRVCALFSCCLSVSTWVCLHRFWWQFQWHPSFIGCCHGNMVLPVVFLKKMPMTSQAWCEPRWVLLKGLTAQAQSESGYEACQIQWAAGVVRGLQKAEEGDGGAYISVGEFALDTNALRVPGCQRWKPDVCDTSLQVWTQKTHRRQLMHRGAALRLGELFEEWVVQAVWWGSDVAQRLAGL